MVNAFHRTLQQIQNGLVLYLPMDEGSGSVIYDESAHLNNGTLNTPTFVTGKYGTGLNFVSAAEQQVTIVNSASLAFGTGSFSICFWVKSPAEAAYDGLISKMDTVTTQRGIAFYREGGGSTHTTLRGLVGDGTNRAITTWNKTVFDDTWHFVVIVADRDSQLLKVYVDASIETQQLNLSAVGSVTSPEVMLLGKSQVGGYLNGVLDEVRIYNRALSQSEITSLYNDGICSDNLGIIDSKLKNKSIIKSIIDKIDSLDSYNRLKTIYRNFTDYLDGIEVKTVLVNRIKSFIELLGYIDTKTKFSDRVRSFIDYIGSLDSKLKSIHWVRIFIDKMGGVDTLIRIKHIFRFITDKLGNKDTYIRLKTIHRIIIEEIEFIDDYLREAWNAILRTKVISSVVLNTRKVIRWIKHVIEGED